MKLSPDVAALNPDIKIPPPPKYCNEPTIVDGLRFDSKKEAQRWGELQLLQAAGAISALSRQVWFDLYGGVRMRVDFTYTENGALVAEDVKGKATRDWLNKAKLFRARYAGEWELRIV